MFDQQPLCVPVVPAFLKTTVLHALHCMDALCNTQGLLVYALMPIIPAGPQLLELLSAFEVTRSNLLRPAGYFADFLQEPEQQQAARQLMQQVGHVTQHVYANTAVLHLLLDTVAQALQQLVEAAAQQGIQAHHEQRPVPPTSSRSGHKADGWGLPASEWQQHFVQLHPGLAVAEGAAAAAAAMAQHACELLQSVTAAHTADSSSSRSKAGGAASTGELRSHVL